MQTSLIRMLLLLPLICVPAGAEEPVSETAEAEARTAQAAGPEPDDSQVIPAADSRVMDEIMLERAEITGNQELPKVLYIVPWQKSDPGDLTGKPVNTLLDEVLAPIDRSEFIRQVEYYDDLYGDNEE